MMMKSMRYVASLMFLAVTGCATLKGETTVLHPSLIGDRESYISMRVKDPRLPYMKFNHIAGMHPAASDRVFFMVRTFSTTKDQVDPRKNKFYLVNDQGAVFQPAEQHRNRLINKYREVSSTRDVAGQLVRIKTPEGTEYFQMHYLEDVDTRIDYYFGYCELSFYYAGIITPETKSLTLVVEQEGRTLKFVWHLTKNPSETSLEVDPEFRPTDNWDNLSKFLPQNNPGSQRVVPGQLNQ